MSMITKTSDQLDDAAEMLLRWINVMFLLAVLVAMTCAVILIAAGTFAVLHNGDDFSFGGGAGGGGDMIRVPSLLF
jgi:hypothetical protein